MTTHEIGPVGDTGETGGHVRQRLFRRLRIRNIAFVFRDMRWFLFAMLVAGTLLSLPTPDGLSRDGLIVLTISLTALILFVTEPVPLPAVALMIIAAQVILLGLDSNAVARSIMSDSVLFIMGSLMLAVAIVKQKLDKRIAFLIIRLTGTKTANVCIGMSFVSGVLASVIGEHTVAAMMLPVAITLISLTSEDPKQVRRLAVVLLLSIAYGCAIAGIATPSGGARNAIMIGYWREFFYDPVNPETYKYLVDYTKWIAYCYPIFLIQLPFVSYILMKTFRPEYTDIARAVVKLRTQLGEQGPMQLRDWGAIAIFVATLLGWILFSDAVGLGTIAILGAIAYLVFGLVKWEDINSNVNWGVVLLYGAAISLGVQMKETGAALWIAANLVDALAPYGADTGVPLWVGVSALTTVVTNTMSNGAAVAVLGPVTLNLATAANESPLLMGFITSVSSAFAYLTVIGTPACTIVYASGYLKPSDFLIAGSRMVILSIVMLIFAAYFYWPQLGL